jgi:spermidine synthase
VLVRERDVIDEVKESRSEYDLILLDVDNGPAALTQAKNAWLYRREGLARLRAALRPGGVLAVWSAGPDAAFGAALRAARFKVEEHRARAHARGGSRHTIWIATATTDERR